MNGEIKAFLLNVLHLLSNKKKKTVSFPILISDIFAMVSVEILECLLEFNAIYLFFYMHNTFPEYNIMFIFVTLI